METETETEIETATRHSILLNEIQTLIGETTIQRRWTTDEEILRHVVQCITNTGNASNYTIGDINKVITTNYTFINDRFRVSPMITLFRLKKRLHPALENGRLSIIFYYINNTDDSINLKRTGREWRDIYIASRDTPLPTPLPMPRRKRKRPTATKPIAPPVTKFAITLEQIKLAWRAMYKAEFPSDIVGLVDMASYTLPPAPHELAAAAAAAAHAHAHTC